MRSEQTIGFRVTAPVKLSPGADLKRRPTEACRWEASALFSMREMDRSRKPARDERVMVGAPPRYFPIIARLIAFTRNIMHVIIWIAELPVEQDHRYSSNHS